MTGCGDTDSTTAANSTVTPLLTWQSQYSFALQNAQQEDKNAVLMSVFAFAKKSYQTDMADNGAVDLEFRFLRPSASTGITISNSVTLHNLTVSFLDVSPTLTLKVDPEESLNASPLSSRTQEEQKAVDYVQVTAEEAVQSTLYLGRQYSILHGVSLEPQLMLVMSPMFPNRYSVPAIWFVNYVANGEQLTVVLDAHTGRILDQYKN